MTNELRRTKAKAALINNDINSPVFWLIYDVLTEALQRKISGEEFIKLLHSVSFDYNKTIKELTIKDSTQQKLFNDENNS